MSAPSAVQTPSRPKMDTKTMVSIAMLTGIAYIVMLLSKLMPSVMFLDFDFKDVVVCIGGFTFGPFAAAIISILVAFIEMLTISHTGPIGFIMNVLATCAFSWHRLLHLQEGPFQEGRGPGPGLRRGVPGRGDAAVELPHHPPVYDRLFPADVAGCCPPCSSPSIWPRAG